MHPAGVDVVIVQPGSVRTPLWRKVAAMDADYATGTVYEAVMERIRATALRGAGRGMDPERVAEAVDRALTAPRPPARIPVVRSRLKMRVMEWLPDRWLDGLIARRLSGGGRG